MALASFEDLLGRRFPTATGYLTVLKRACLKPLKWTVICSRCESSWNEFHVALRESGDALRCKNSACGRTRIPSRSSGLVETREVPAPVRTRDSQDVAEYEAGLRAAEQMINERAKFDKYHNVASTVWGFTGQHLLSFESWNQVSEQKRDEIMQAIEREERQ
jgi:hypothetical protein